MLFYDQFFSKFLVNYLCFKFLRFLKLLGTYNVKKIKKLDPSYWNLDEIVLNALNDQVPYILMIENLWQNNSNFWFSHFNFRSLAINIIISNLTTNSSSNESILIRIFNRLFTRIRAHFKVDGWVFDTLGINDYFISK